MRISLSQGGKFFLDQSKVSSQETQVVLLILHFLLMIKNTDRILFLPIYKEAFLTCRPGQITDTEASLLYHRGSSIIELQIREHKVSASPSSPEGRHLFPRN